MADCIETHRAKETKSGGWKRYVDCRCDLEAGHEESHRCRKHRTKFAVLRRMTVYTSEPAKEEHDG